MNDLVKKNKKGQFVKGNQSSTNENRELARQRREEEKQQLKIERAALVKRVKKMRGDDVTLEEIEDELALSDGATAIVRVKTMYKRLMYESAMIEDVDWKDPKQRKSRQDLLANLRALSALIKEFSVLQGVPKAWESPRAVPVAQQRKFDNNVVGIMEAAKKKVKEASTKAKNS